ncbi:MAG: replication-associated recombination protein A, partial [Planctomycetota bacterium]
LFAEQRRQNARQAMPLAARVRPRSLDEFQGQRHLLGDGMLLRRLIEADRLQSLLFYGPPGTGKTTLGRIIADTTNAAFRALNAAAANVKEVRALLDEARDRLETEGTRTLLFLDEIHRFNRAQQDVLLGDVEEGIVVLIGATTENPFFSVNSALVSRSQIFQFEPLGDDDIAQALRSATSDERGFPGKTIDLSDDAIAHWTKSSEGDARRALAALEVAVLTEKPINDAIRIDLAVAEQSIQKKALRYDRQGDEHYDHASAFIKSMRASDPDAALYWLARMLEAGEDPRFIARRIAIFASEDVGLADPQAIQVADSAWNLVAKLGLPEGKLTLAHATLHMATAPKSRSATSAIGRAIRDVNENATLPVPRKYRDAHYAGSKRLGHGAAADDDEYLGVESAYFEPENREPAE